MADVNNPHAEMVINNKRVNASSWKTILKSDRTNDQSEEIDNEGNN